MFEIVKKWIASIGRTQSIVLASWYLSNQIAMSIEWKLADLWIGAYAYTHQPIGTLGEETNLYLIAIPTIVLHIAWREG